MTNQPAYKRSKLQIYYIILSIIKDNIINIDTKPIKLQEKSNLSYDKLMHYLKELMEKGFITNNRNKLLITKKGEALLYNYEKLLMLYGFV